MAKVLMTSIKQNFGAIALFVLITVAGFLLPVSINMIIDSHEESFQGEPIANTLYAQIVSDAPDLVMLPEGDVNKTKDTLYMTIDYSPLVMVNLTDAINRASAFISKIPYLSNRALSHVENGYNLDYNNGMWSIKFEDSQISVWVSVNAISGKIAGFRSFWTSESPNPYRKDADATNRLNASAIETRVVQFLNEMNYTLSPFTMVLAPVLDTGPMYFSWSTYIVRFYCVMNNTLIEGNQLFFHIDIESGDILGFYYFWTHFGQVPTEGVISDSVAVQEALSYIDDLRNYTEVRITSSMLVLEKIQILQSNASEYQLEWIVFGTFSQENLPFSIRVEPLSGKPSLLSEPKLILLEFSMMQEKIFAADQIVLVLSFSFVVAAILNTLVRRHLTVANASSR